ncbi:MAG: tetratricopeptide repeat protein [Candidatus Omnitrophica bacterium]|nr:tetratricopeptide repeat protein [Candidatus Omnitrophota bacterium]MBU0895729.1 tetratricopeptide repeat protein [Candidatus Omnitrophota bacterium]MBU1808269.1 tetratricopeptide repeat protein [Candidatus Omnitrophota bacterium]
MNNKNYSGPVFLRGPLVYAIIAGTGFLVYFKSLFFGFTYLDDNVLVINNHRFLSQLSNVFEAFRHEVFHILHSSAAYYRPMLTVSFILDAQFGGVSPFIYHFTNIIIHLAASCLVFKFLTKLGYRRQLAFFFSLIFSVHPILAQAVSWIPGRNDSLAALFVFASFIFFLDFLDTKRIGYCLAHIFFLGLAMFTKESALLLMPVCALYYILIWKKERRKREDVSHQGKSLLFICTGWLTVTGFWFFLRSVALSNNPLPMTGADMAKSVFLNLPALIQFIGKIIFPFNLSVLPLIQDTTFIYGILALALIVPALFFSKGARTGFIVFGASWFLLFLLPSFIRPNPTIVADFIEHRAYLPMVGFFILLLEIDAIKTIDFRLKRYLAAAGVVIILFAAITFIHTDNFKNRLSFWLNAATKSPHSPLAHRNLGAMYYLDGLPDKAEPEYRKALELNPLEQMAHNNLGLIYASRGNYKDAEEEYKKELAVNPAYDDVRFNLGILYYKLGEFKKAETLWKKVIELNPDHIGAYANLHAYYYSQGDFTQAAYFENEFKKRE